MATLHSIDSQSPATVEVALPHLSVRLEAGDLRSGAALDFARDLVRVVELAIFTEDQEETKSFGPRAVAALDMALNTALALMDASNACRFADLEGGTS